MHNIIDSEKYSNLRLSGSITLDYKICDGLFLKGNYGVNSMSQVYKMFKPLIEGQPFPRPEAELRQSYSSEYTIVSETYLSFYRIFARKHTVNFSGGFRLKNIKEINLGQSVEFF